MPRRREAVAGTTGGCRYPPTMTPERQDGSGWSDPRHWRGGWLHIYANRDDPRLWVPKRRPGLGWTLNMKHPKARLVLGDHVVEHESWSRRARDTGVRTAGEVLVRYTAHEGAIRWVAFLRPEPG